MYILGGGWLDIDVLLVANDGVVVDPSIRWTMCARIKCVIVGLCVSMCYARTNKTVLLLVLSVNR